jgi:hypothetical protein
MTAVMTRNNTFNDPHVSSIEIKQDGWREQSTFEDKDLSEDVRRIRRVSRLVSLEAALGDETWISTKAPPDENAVVPYLLLFGYVAADHRRWEQTQRPELVIKVTEHAEINEHTWYLIDCSLSFADASESECKVRWQTARRLCHMRELLYDHVKSDLGDSYNKHFAGAHFAYRGGLPGTTSRLSDWCMALAACINSGAASPYAAVLTLRFVDAPHLKAIDVALDAADIGIDPAMALALSIASKQKAPPSAPEKGKKALISDAVWEKALSADKENRNSRVQSAVTPTTIGAVDEHVDSAPMASPDTTALPVSVSLDMAEIAMELDGDIDALGMECCDAAKNQVDLAGAVNNSDGIDQSGDPREDPAGPLCSSSHDDEDMSIPISSEGGMSNPTRAELQSSSTAKSANLSAILEEESQHDLSDIQDEQCVSHPVSLETQSDSLARQVAQL